MIEIEPELGQRLHPDYEFTRAQVVWAVRNEMARTVEDFGLGHKMGHYTVNKIPLTINICNNNIYFRF